MTEDNKTIKVTISGKSYSEIALKEKLLDMALYSNDISKELRKILIKAVTS